MTNAGVRSSWDGIVQVAYAVDGRPHHGPLGSPSGSEPGRSSSATTISPATSTTMAKPAEFDHCSAYGQWGAVQIELVEVHAGRAGEPGRIVQRASGIHHVATFVASIDDEQRRLVELGWPPVMTAETAGGLRYAFHDTRGRSSATCSRCTSHRRACSGCTRMVAEAAERVERRGPRPRVVSRPFEGFGALVLSLVRINKLRFDAGPTGAPEVTRRTT